MSGSRVATGNTQYVRSAFSIVRKHIQAILAFSLLAFQAWIPWSVTHLVTQDGPSHLYTAIVARDLLLHPHSQYATVYGFNHRIVPNWGSTIVLGLIASIVGAAHAEQLFISLAIGAGFFAFSYAIRAISPDAQRWTPLTNFLLQSWFLWLGFYNFYLAMALCPFVIGYYIRHASAFTIRRAAVLACGMAALFLTHLIPAILAGLAVVLIAIWVNVAVPRLLAEPLPYRIVASRLAAVACVFVPVVALFGWFAASSREPINFHSGFIRALEIFPMHVFVTSSGRAGNQSLLQPAVLCLMVLAILTMRKGDWQTARGGLAIGTVAAFLVYLSVPDAGFGGKEAKIRFAWGVFILGGLVLATARRLRPLRIPFDIYVFALLIATLVSTQHSLWNYSDAVDDYLYATKEIPRGARFVRLRYPTPDIPIRYGFEDLGRDPLFHLDSYVAAQCKCIDMTDYQAPNNIFPVVFSPAIEIAQRYGLWSFETPRDDAAEVLKWLQSTLPVPIDYVILVADESTPGVNGASFNAVLKRLDSSMRLVATSGGRPFVRVYRRTPPTGAVIESPLRRLTN